MSMNFGGWVAAMCLEVALSTQAFAQAPVFTAAGVVNAASYAQPIAPGAIVSIFGTNLGPIRATAYSSPFLTSMAETSVTVGGVKAPLFFVSPNQINFQAPASLPNSPFGYTLASIVVTTPSGSSTPVDVPVYPASPAAFTTDGSGCGQAAALNVASDGSVSPNSAANSASPGDIVALYGTGLGLSINQPPDGIPSAGAAALQVEPGVLIDGNFLPAVSYAGLAPGLVGVDQINFQIPPGTREGCAVTVAVAALPLIGPSTTIAIHTGRGPCVDSAVQSYGQVSLTKTVASGTANDGETEVFRATFPAGPGLHAPIAANSAAGSSVANSQELLPVSRTCLVAGYAQLSAGAIQLTAAGTGAAITAQPVSQAAGVSYQQALPAGFISPGPYAISASGGAVAFQGAFPVGGPIQIQTALGPGTQIPSDRPFTVRWTGGAAGTLVKVTLTSGQGMVTQSDYAYADATSGSFTFQPICSGFHPVVCTFGLPPGNHAQVTMEVSPAPGNATVLGARGITGTVSASWTYRYIFGGLTLG